MNFITGILSVICLGSMSLYLFLARNKQSDHLLSLNLGPLRIRDKLFLSFAAIGLFVCMYRGCVELLFWVPNKWGDFDEDGTFQSTKHLIALVFSLISGYALIAELLDGMTNKEEANKQQILKIEILRILESAGDQIRLQRLANEFKEKAESLKIQANLKAKKKWGNAYHSGLDSMNRAGNTAKIYFELAAKAENLLKPKI